MIDSYLLAATVPSPPTTANVIIADLTPVRYPVPGNPPVTDPAEHEHSHES